MELARARLASQGLLASEQQASQQGPRLRVSEEPGTRARQVVQRKI
jgi:hypothetical protein